MSQPDPMDSLVRTPLGLPSVHMQGLASHLHDFREQASLGQDPPETVLSKRIVVALEFVHRGDLFADVFGAEARQSFDWECVNSNLENGSMVEPLEVAIAALQLVSFRLSMTPADVSERSRESPLAFMLETVAENPELRGLSPQHVYRLHVLTNQMTVLDKLNAVEVYTSLALRRATARASTNLMARLASRKFKVQQYHDDFVAMFRDASYEVDTLRRCETRFRRAGEEQPPDARTERGHRGAAAGEKLNFAGRRPCLLEIIQDSDPAGSGALARLALENSADGANTFESFCNFVPFHASLSARSRKLVYFLAAQRHIPVLEHIEAVTSFQSTREVPARVDSVLCWPRPIPTRMIGTAWFGRGHRPQTVSADTDADVRCAASQEGCDHTPTGERDHGRAPEPEVLRRALPSAAGLPHGVRAQALLGRRRAQHHQPLAAAEAVPVRIPTPRDMARVLEVRDHAPRSPLCSPQQRLEASCCI